MSEAKNLFCDFANKEIRRVFGLFVNETPATQQVIIGRWLNIAVFLCPEWSLIPAGFVVECGILQATIKTKESFLFNGVLRLAMRGGEIAQFIERRRAEYAPFRDDYAPLFTDEAYRILELYSIALQGRTGRSAESIVETWAASPDRHALWQPGRELVTLSNVELVRYIPRQIVGAGLGVTWNALHERLPPAALSDANIIRRALHQIFVHNYLNEYNLDIVTRLPCGWGDLGLRLPGGPADYELFKAATAPLQLTSLLETLAAPALVHLRRTPGYLAFKEYYDAAGLAGAKPADLYAIYSQAYEAKKILFQQLRRALNSCVRSTTGEMAPTDDCVELLGFVLGDVSAYVGGRFRPGTGITDRVPRIYIFGGVNMGDKIINIGSGARISAPVVIADTIQDSFNAAQGIADDRLRALVETLIRNVATTSQSVDEAEVSNLGAATQSVVKALAAPTERQSTLERLKRYAAYVGTFGAIAEPIVKTVEEIVKWFQ